MKVKYEFATGEVVEVEVDEKIGKVIVELDREEFNNNQTETRRHCTISVLGDEGEWMLDKSQDPYEIVPEQIENECRFKKAMDSLSESQRDVLIAVGYMGMSLSEYAKKRGIDHSTASRNFLRAKTNFKKVF